jgi:hypothetical protein
MNFTIYFILIIYKLNITTDITKSSTTDYTSMVTMEIPLKTISLIELQSFYLYIRPHI